MKVTAPVLGLMVNWLAAALLAFTIFFYVVIYTIWLKRWTPQNIVIGGAAGAFPPVIGWAAASGSIAIEPIVMFLIIFVWTPPHFWALALLRADEYARAGIPMLPVVAGDSETRRQIVLYSFLLAPVGVLPWLLGYAGLAYGAVAVVSGVLFVLAALRLRKAATTLLSNGAEAGPALAAIPGVTRVLASPGGGYEVESERGTDVRRELAKAVVNRGWGLLELRPMRMSLEEIFLQVTTDESAAEAPRTPVPRKCGRS